MEFFENEKINPFFRVSDSRSERRIIMFHGFPERVKSFGFGSVIPQLSRHEVFFDDSQVAEFKFNKDVRRKRENVEDQNKSFKREILSLKSLKRFENEAVLFEGTKFELKKLKKTKSIFPTKLKLNFKFIS